MNKKVLSAILFSALFAGTGTFTSCIDNDEPAGIEELRGAKAELIRAKVAVEQANAAHKLALAEVEKGNAAIKAAIAKQEEAKAKFEEAKAEAQAAATAEAKAYAEMKAAEYQEAMKVAALEHEADMLDLQKALAIAERQYELTLAQIEIAKQLFPFETYVELSRLEDDVKKAQRKVNRKAEALALAKKDYDDAAIDYKYKGELQKTRLENRVAKAEADLKAKKEELAKWEGFLENDVETATWRAEIDSLNALVDALAKDTATLKLNAAKAENSDEYIALQAAFDEASEAATVDTVYGYKYFGEEYATTLYFDEDEDTTKMSTGLTEIAEEAAKKALVVDAMDTIAQYDVTTGDLTAGILYENKKELASYTAEVRHFLDSVANKKAENDTIFEYNAKVAIKAWKDAKEAYEKADTTIKALKDTAAKYYYSNWSENADASTLTKRTFTKAEDMGDFAKAMLDYLTVAKKNGAVLNNILAFDDSIKRPAIVGTAIVEKDSAAYSMQDPLEVLKDTVKTYSAYKEFEVDFFIPASGTTTKAFTVLDKATAKKKEFTNNLFAIKTAAPDTDQLYNAAVLASTLAFGQASLYKTIINSEHTHGVTGYLHVQPDSIDVLNVVFFNKYNEDQIHAEAVENVSNGIVGAYGKYLIANSDAVKKFANEYKSVMADLEAAIAYWEATYKALDAKYTAWEAAKDAAKDAKDAYYTANIEGIDDQIEVIDGRIDRIKDVVEALQDAVETYLDDKLKGSKDYDLNADATAEAFTEILQGLIDDAQDYVKKAENKLANAQIKLEKNGDDDSAYNSLETEKAELEKAQAELEKAQAELEEALANLAKGLEILGVSAE